MSAPLHPASTRRSHRFTGNRPHRAAPIWILLLGILGCLELHAAPAGVTVSPPVIGLGDLWLLNTDPDHDAVRANVSVVLNRAQPGQGARDIPIRYTMSLVENAIGGATIRTITHSTIVTVPPVAVNLPVLVQLEIVPGQILSQAKTYVLRLNISHVDDPPGGVYLSDHTVTTAPNSYAHFSGKLSFGAIDTSMLGLSLPPFALPAPNAWRLWIGEGVLSTGIPFANAAPSTAALDITRDDTTGDAAVLLGSVLVSPPDDAIAINGWTGQLGPVLLDLTGLHADTFTLDLPEGVGWRRDDANAVTPQTLSGVFQSEGAGLYLDEMMAPLGPVSGILDGTREYVDERLGLGMLVGAWTWDLQALIFDGPKVRFQRQWHYDQWKTVKTELPDTNDGYWDQLTGAMTTSLSILPGMTGGFNGRMTLGGGVFSTHFPHGFVAHTGGALVLVNSAANPATSGLNLATTTVLTYVGCRPSFDPHALPPPETLEAIQVGPGTLRFTAQGSLWTEGSPLPDPNPVDDVPLVQRVAAGLGDDSVLPVHESSSFAGQNVQIHIPGPTVPAADGLDSTLDGNASVDEVGEHPDAFNPARWLFTGVRVSDVDELEHPGTDEYVEGAADYAGANFRHFEGLTGVSRVGGGQMGPYDMDGCFKAYTRASGVTGRWLADETTLPPMVQIGGPEPFTMTLDSWAFQLVSNEPHFENSAVAGSVALPYPADFTLAFDSIEFSCCGNFERLELGDGEALKTMAYWQQARIDIQSARFVSAEPCSMADSILELHVRARANGFEEALDGILGFRGNGRMTTGADALHAASLLHLPVGARFAGDYYVEPVKHGFYNDPDPMPGTDEGFISVIGLMDLPFFEAMPSHGLTSGTELPAELDPNLIPGIQGGWTAGGNSYFNNAEFDAPHRGMPPAFNSPLDYLTSESEDYLPRARRTWFGRVPFDFPVVYDAPTRHFHSAEKKEIDVIIAQAEADVPRLNHAEAAIDFGLTVGLSLNNLLSEALTFATGELVEGFADLTIGSALDALSEGLADLDEMLSLQVRDAIGEPVLPSLDGIAAASAETLSGGGIINDAMNAIDFDGAVQDAIASATATHVTSKLGPIGNGLAGTIQFLAPEASGEIAELMERAMDFLNLPADLDLLGALDLIELAGLETGPVRDRLEELRGRMQELRDLVENVTGLDGELTAVLTGANAEFQALETDVRNALQDYFEMVAVDPLVYTPAEIEARIRAEIQDRLWALPVMGQVQNVLRFRFYHVDHLVRQVVNSALDQLNLAIADLVSEAVDLDELLGELTGIGSYVQAASLKGEAVITGDDLTYLSLKGHTTIHTQPIPLNFDPFYEYQQLHADGAKACDPNPALAPAVFNRITMGATVAPATMPFGEVSVTISTQFSFTDDGRILGFMGGFETLQEGLSMQPVNFDRLSVLMNIGGNDPSFSEFQFYIAAEGNATLFDSPSPVQLPWSNFKLHGGLFAGRTCTDAPYAAWAQDIPVNAPFLGAIAMVDGKFPFFDSSCMLRLKAGARVGAWGGAEELNVGDYSGLSFTVGALMAGNISGDFLCLVSGGGSIEMMGMATSQGASLDGSIAASLKLGFCPFCVELDPNFGVHLDTESGISVDF